MNIFFLEISFFSPQRILYKFALDKKKTFKLGLKSITFHIRSIQILYISFYTFIIINNTFWQMDHQACHCHIFAQKGYMSSKIPNSALHVFSN